MKKKKDPGLEYVISLGINPAKTQAAFYSRLVDEVGQKTADRIDALMDKRRENLEAGIKGKYAAFSRWSERESFLWMGCICKIAFLKKGLDKGLFWL